MKPTSKKNKYVIDWEKLIKKEEKTQKTSKIKVAKPTNKIKMGKKLKLEFQKLG